MNTVLKNLILTALLVWTGGTAAVADDGVRVDQTRKVEPYTAISYKAVGNVHFTPDDRYTFRITGRGELVNNIVTTVKDGTLVIGLKESKKNYDGRKDRVDIYVTAPTLESVKFDGVGNFVCREKLEAGDIRFKLDGVGSVDVVDLRCDRLEVSVEGVGNADINVQADHVDATVNGVGSIRLKGSTRTADLERNGIGRIRTKGFVIEEE